MSVRGHVSHARAQAWFARERPRFATCPITQGALIRFLCREGAPIREAKAILARLTGQSQHEFWPDDVSYLDLEERGLTGHKQVTDYYLASLARARGAKLATIDEALAAILAGVCVRV